MLLAATSNEKTTSDAASESHAQAAVGLNNLISRGRTDAQFEAKKILRHTDRLHDWLNGRDIVPITLELDITLSCNDRCPRCVHRFALQERHLSLFSIQRILIDAVALQVRGVTLTGGGDPLRHPEFGGILNLMQTIPISAGMFTNGGLIANACMAEEMVRSFQWIRVSLDSASESTFRRVRGVKDIGERLACLARLPEARKTVGAGCELGVSFLTSNMVATDIVEATRIISALGFDYIQFKPMIDWKKGTHHLSASLDQKDVFQAIERATEFESDDFKVLCSTKKYCADTFNENPQYSEFHSAWFVATVAPSLGASFDQPALYLDCSSKYIDRWKISEFGRLGEVLTSTHRREFIQSTSSRVYCVPPEKHAAYNRLLEEIWARHQVRPWSLDELRQLAPSGIKHEQWL
jgi:MoaA/NifB/PqqE/SkfB family radical SAM enzyme